MTQKHKRPGSAATLAEPVSTSEKDLNVKTNSTKAGRAATVSLNFDPSILDNLSVNGRQGLYDTFHLTAEVLLGVMQQPRFFNEGDFNGAGAFIEELVKFFHHAKNELVEAERCRKEEEPGDHEAHLFLLLRHKADASDGLAELAALAAQFVVDHQKCEFEARIAKAGVA